VHKRRRCLWVYGACESGRSIGGRPNDEAIKASQQCLNPVNAPGGSQEAKEDVSIEWRLTSIAEQLRMAITLLIQSYASRHPLPLGTRYPSSPQP